MRIRKAIIPAAGLGKRYAISSIAQPKEIMPVGTKPVMHYALEELWKSGISEVLIITSRNKSAIEDYLDVSLTPNTPLLPEEQEHIREIETITSDVFVTYSRQKKFRGPANAIYEARKFVKDDPFLVLLPDDLCFYGTKPVAKQLIDAFESHDTSIVGLKHVQPEDYETSSLAKGELIGTDLYKIKELVKFPKEHVSNMGTIGRYALTPKFFSSVERTQPNSMGELSMTEVLNHMLSDDTIYGLMAECEHFDVGNPVGHIAAQINFAMREPKYRKRMQSYIANWKDDNQGRH